MAIDLGKEVVEALNDRDSVKVIATVNGQGVPHVVFKENLFYKHGRLILLELIETSQTNSNLVHSIWFNRTVAVNVKDKYGRSWQIKGLPVKTHISGRLYEAYYEKTSQPNPEIDLGAVWEIEPVEVKSNEIAAVLTEEKKKHPYLFHLDKIVK